MSATLIDEIITLPNHLFFNQILNNALINAYELRLQLALIFIKIENFFQCCSQHGNAESNFALQELGLRFKALLGSEDSLARFEIDEFALLLPNVEDPQVLDLTINKIIELSALPIDIDSRKITFITSIGMAVFPQDGETLEDLEKAASLAQKKPAKKSTDNNHQYYAAVSETSNESTPQLQSQLSQALNNHEFMLFYQPQFNLKEKRITGVEALIRWNHPQHGVLTPSRFIPLAESSGFIIELGEWVLKEACRTNKEWQNAGYKPINMSINLSPQQLHYAKLPDLIEKALQETQLAPQYLNLEITEMTVMHDTKRINALFDWIKNKGISISIDDFGTGNTSARYLNDFPINVLKIDQSFIKNLPQDKANVAHTCEMVNLAHSLGMKVVAEGIENMDQLEFLASKDCDMAQGYFISRPLPKDQLTAMLEK